MFAVLCALLVPAAAYFDKGTRSPNSVTYEKFNDPNDDLSDLNPMNNVEVQQKIEQYHNEFRSQVNPPASNMLYMSWHPGAAASAQRYAEKCLYLQHSPEEETIDPSLGSCGENLYESSQTLSWFSVVEGWFLEYRNFTYGSPDYNLHDIGHYTQVVWANSHKVGCGLAHCPGGPWGQFYNYVCHYCPSGNVNPVIEFPYKAGNPCEDCPNDCTAGSLCTNACFTTDRYSNCNKLVDYPGTCASGDCNATCTCHDKLFKNYPWQ